MHKVTSYIKHHHIIRLIVWSLIGALGVLIPALIYQVLPHPLILTLATFLGLLIGFQHRHIVRRKSHKKIDT